ncbi:hypothetical protein AMJ83_10880 [candidate division WOR_3 bacterium SM23_42]|uniref:Uncharacterized protein n=1 Tax=candidate division WOR_3 bacterium SM23_42 TaxID=1703779 RepID=A0A0S8FP28_UNCW3|nr:MAG: hypothetical protein AMJ83_10880 [candidate division WOR_3 bacterium SM23_42]
MIVDIVLHSVIIAEIGGKIVRYILIALGVVVVLWIISVLIQKSDKRARERYIKEKQEQRRKEEEERERANRPSFPVR